MNVPANGKMHRIAIDVNEWESWHTLNSILAHAKAANAANSFAFDQI